LNYEGARDLLESVHAFPCAYTIKVIGQADGGFVRRIVEAACEGLGRAADVHHWVRHTPAGRHESVTLEISVLSSDEVLRVYAALQQVEGIKLLL
jgi:putative lipoic acid-binding regulatory protein